jgi:tripartite-type tricarboxylate transporter receptor subunit TctC
MNLESSNRRRLLASGAGGLVLGTLGSTVQAQSSARLVKVMVGFPPGGSTDVVARLVADHIRANFSPNVIVENKPGGGGRTVLEQARAGDGDNVVVVLTPTGMLTIFPHVYRNLGYDTFRDYTAIGSAATFVTAVTLGAGVPDSVKTLRDLLDWARQNPRKASYGSPGSGSAMHFTGTMLERLAGGNMTHVPYKGAAPMIQDLLGGQIPIGMVPIGDAVPHARAGKLRVVATSGAQRSRFLPDVPTARESGYADIVTEDHFTFVVPRRTPADVAERLGAVISDAARRPELAERLAQFGLEPRATTPAQMNAILRADFDTWAPIVKASGFTAED